MCSSKLFFYHAPMNSGKSMLLIAKAYSFGERGIPYLVFKSSTDTRNEGVIHSRALGDISSITISPEERFLEKYDFANTDVKWVLVDEAQFLTPEQVDELTDLVDDFNINVICYGLRTDFKTHLFDGSKRLFEVADTIEEIKSQCSCSNKNLFNARIDKQGNIVIEGKQIEVGAEDKYIAVCRRCYKKMKKLVK